MVLVAIGAVLADAAMSANRMYSQVKLARASLDAGVESLVVGDEPAATLKALRDAESQAASASALGSGFSIRTMGWVPVIGDNFSAGRHMADAIAAEAEAALDLRPTAKALDWTSIRVPGTGGPLSLVNAHALNKYYDSMERVASTLGSATADLRAARPGGLLLPSVSRGYEDILGSLQRRANLMTDFVAASVVAEWISTTGPYAVEITDAQAAVSGRAPIFATGTLIGRGGVLRLNRLQPGSAPPSANAAGVIRIDVAALSDLLWISGPLETRFAVAPSPLRPEMTPNRDGVLSADDIASVWTALTNAGSPDQTAQARADLVYGVLSALLGSRPSTEAFAIGMARCLRAGTLHISISDEGLRPPGLRPFLDRLQSPRD